MRPIHLKLRRKKYQVLTGLNCTQSLPKILNSSSYSQISIFYDRKLVTHYRSLKKTLTRVDVPIHYFPVSAEEKIKDLSAIEKIYKKLIQKKMARDSLIIAMGGGAIGDAIGFVAATYMRGVDWMNIPSTLLAQVDSSIGGKTAVNHQLGKNLIGAFHQPQWIFADSRLLKTLPRRELISGLGEVLKYGLIEDQKFFRYCQKNLKALLRGEARPVDQVTRLSIEQKIKVVSRDEFDKKGIRAQLNFGHTLGHVLEAIMGYGKIRHGEAVAHGMRLALALSTLRGHLSKTVALEAIETIEELPLPKIPQNLTLKQIHSYLQRDKKNQGGRVAFVLLKDIGQVIHDSHVEPQDIRLAFEWIGSPLKA